jgi:hypothetical protein
VENKVEDTMLRYQKHKVRRADTGARLACARQLLALKTKYTREDLQNPFVVARIDFSPDLSDNEIKRLIIQQFSNSTRALYAGPGAFTGSRTPSAVSKPEPETGGEVVEEESGDSEEDEKKENLESQVRTLMKDEVITENERARIEAGLKEGMDEPGLKKGLSWLKDQIQERRAILKKEKEEAEQLSMPWEQGEQDE